MTRTTPPAKPGTGNDAFAAGMQAGVAFAQQAILHGSQNGKDPLESLEQAYKAVALASTGVVAPWFVPVVAALPPNIAAAIGLALPTGGASLALAFPNLGKAARGILGKFKL